MKKRNILNHVFLGLGILVSGSMFGLSSANADTLKDTNGNSVEYNKSYYLESAHLHGQGISHGYWNLGQWAYLERNTLGLPIKLINEIRNERYVSDGSNVAIQMQTTNLPFSYLGVNKVYNGIQLSGYDSETSTWRAENFSNSDNSVTFKNHHTNKHLHNQGSGYWLDANARIYTEKLFPTRWKLVPQN